MLSIHFVLLFFFVKEENKIEKKEDISKTIVDNVLFSPK